MKARRGKINLLAVGLSAAAHVVLLGSLATVRMGASAQPASTPLGAVSLQTVKHTVQVPLVTPKPEIKPQSKPQIPDQPQLQPVVALTAQTLPTAPPAQPQTIPTPSESDKTPETFEAEFFGQDTVANTVCFVVDCSGSMYGRMGLISKQLKDCIASLYEKQSFYMIFFMNGDRLFETGDGRAVPASGFAKAKAFEMIDNIHLEGQTNARQALERAMKIRDHRGRPVELVYFLTDGFNLQIDSWQTFCNDIAAMRRKYAPAVTINTIGLWVSPEDGLMLEKIATMTGGQYTPVPEVRDAIQ